MTPHAFHIAQARYYRTHPGWDHAVHEQLQLAAIARRAIIEGKR